MKPLSERDENSVSQDPTYPFKTPVGMKPLSERDENSPRGTLCSPLRRKGRNEATL